MGGGGLLTPNFSKSHCFLGSTGMRLGCTGMRLGWIGAACVFGAIAENVCKHTRALKAKIPIPNFQFNYNPSGPRSWILPDRPRLRRNLMHAAHQEGPHPAEVRQHMGKTQNQKMTTAPMHSSGAIPWAKAEHCNILLVYHHAWMSPMCPLHCTMPNFTRIWCLSVNTCDWWAVGCAFWCLDMNPNNACSYMCSCSWPIEAAAPCMTCTCTISKYPTVCGKKHGTTWYQLMKPQTKHFIAYEKIYIYRGVGREQWGCVWMFPCAEETPMKMTRAFLWWKKHPGPFAGVSLRTETPMGVSCLEETPRA